MQPVKRYCGVEVMNVMMTDRSREPLHPAAQFEIARRIQRRVGKIPFIRNRSPGTRETVLCVKQIGTVRVQRSTNLVGSEDWQTVSRDAGPGELLDTEAGTTPYRFYRGIEE